MTSTPEPSMSESTLAVFHWLERHKAGDEAARRELLDVSMRRLRVLARKILSNIPSVRTFEETDDLLQNSLVRLWKCLADHRPDTSVDFFRLAACLIRRELIDLSRHHFGQTAEIESVKTQAAALDDSRLPMSGFAALDNDTFDPQRLSQWTEFHEYVEHLPEQDKAFFDLLWYQGLSMAETSALLDIPLRTLSRKWKTVRVRLYRDLLCENDDGEFESNE